MSTENARAAVAGLVTEIESYLAEAHDVLKGIENEEAYNREPDEVVAALREAESKYQEVISHANRVVGAAEDLIAACLVLDADGFPQQLTFDAKEAVVENLQEDLARIQKALARFRGVPEATGGEIVESDSV